ncbi:hypothetical protein YC2023_024290 [Brassica napus]
MKLISEGRREKERGVSGAKDVNDRINVEINDNCSRYASVIRRRCHLKGQAVLLCYSIIDNKGWFNVTIEDVIKVVGPTETEVRFGKERSNKHCAISNVEKNEATYEKCNWITDVYGDTLQ